METSTSIAGIADPFSSLSHLTGALVFLAASPLLVRRGRGNRRRVASLVVFCVGGVLLLLTSGLYHLMAPEGAGRDLLRRLDHAAIFALIACSFTPIHVILFRGTARWGMLLLVWTFGATALALKLLYFKQLPHAVGLGLYLAMGWIGLGSGIALWRRHGFRFVEPLLWGGAAYSLGAVLDALHWPVIVPGVIQWHEVFHVAVLIGLASHWSFIFAIADGKSTPGRAGPEC